MNANSVSHTITAMPPSATGVAVSPETSEKRICPTTGLPIFRTAEFFVKANAVLGVVFLLLGGIAALLIALTRWQTIHLLPVDWFYRILTFHGINMLIFWILFGPANAIPDDDLVHRRIRTGFAHDPVVRWHIADAEVRVEPVHVIIRRRRCVGHRVQVIRPGAGAGGVGPVKQAE